MVLDPPDVAKVVYILVDARLEGHVLGPNSEPFHMFSLPCHATFPSDIGSAEQREQPAVLTWAHLIADVDEERHTARIVARQPHANVNIEVHALR